MNAPFKPPRVLEPQAVRFTANEFLALAAQDILRDRRIELVNGEIVELPPPSPRHGRFQISIGARLSSALTGNASYWVSGDTAILLDEDTVRACDAAIVQGSDGSSALSPEQIVLAIEISISTIGYDLGEKSLAYAKAEIPTLWVVDPDAAVTHVFEEPTAGHYTRRSIVRFGEPLTIPGSDATITID